MSEKVTHTPGDHEGRARFMPAYGVMLQMCHQIIVEAIGAEGLVLVVGAGGGLETEAFARRSPSWRFRAVDPDLVMLDAARERIRACGAEDRTDWVHGFVHDAPRAPCDAATCLLTLHFAADDGQKLQTLAAIRDRLRPQAPLLLVDLCMDKAAPDYPLRLARYRQFALDSGAPVEQVDQTQSRLRDVLHTVSEAREAALIAEAGFGHVELFYAAHSWRGWVVSA